MTTTKRKRKNVRPAEPQVRTLSVTTTFSGSVNYRVTITDPDYTPERVAELLRAGRLSLDYQEHERRLIVPDGTIDGKVIGHFYADDHDGYEEVEDVFKVDADGHALGDPSK